MATSPLQPIAGSDGRVQIGSTILNDAKYKISFKAADLPVTNFESTDENGVCWAERITGIREADISFTGSYDQGQPPFAEPPNLVPGELLEDVSIFVSKTSSKSFDFDSIAVLSADIDTDVNGVVTVAITAKSNGSFTWPE